MNKEVGIAIAIGVIIGAVVAAFLNRQALPFFRGSVPKSVTSTITALPSQSVIKKTVFVGIDRKGAVVNDEYIQVKVVASEKTPVVIQTLEEVLVRQEKNPTIRVRLKPGYNEIRAVNVADRGTGVETGTMFYLQNSIIASRTAQIESIAASKSAQASDEAELLKQRLQEKVIALRYNAKKAVYGTVDELAKSVITVTTQSGKKSIVIEPDATRYYQIDGYGVDEIESDDIKKGDTVTVFISTIGDDEKSYTVYREPATRMVTGRIAQIDTTNYQISVLGIDRGSAAYDVETTTQQQIWNPSKKALEKIGFSKLTVGDRFFGTFTPRQNTKPLVFYVAVRR